MQDRKLNIAVCGFGYLGRWHCEKVEKSGLANLVAIVEPAASARVQAGAQFPQAATFASVQELPSSLALDGVVIVTPTSTHFELIAHFMARPGLAIFCEKPVCSSLAELEQLTKLMEQARREQTTVPIWQVGHSERCHHFWQTLQHEYHGILADPSTIITLNRLAPYKDRALDVNVVWDLTIHDLDLICALCQERPITLQATGGNNCTDSIDYLGLTLRFASGRTAFINTSRNAARTVRDLEIVSAQGSCYVDTANLSYALVDQKGKEMARGHYPKQDHLLREHELFYKSIQTQQNQWVSFEEGIYNCYLVLKTVESLELGQEISLERSPF